MCTPPLQAICYPSKFLMLVRERPSRMYRPPPPMQAIFSYPSEFLMLVKERQSGMYRLSAYYLARSLADLPMDCMLPTVMIWILYFMGGLRLTAAAFFGNW